MAYYVRKIARSKWALLNQQSEDILGNYKADTIANDIRTTNNTISLWKTEDLTEENMEPLIVVNSLLGDTISKMELLIIPEDLLEDFSLQQEDGNTIVSRYRSAHYNVEHLTVNKHIQFARDVVLNIVKSENEKPNKPSDEKLIIRIRDKDQLPLIYKWASQNEFSYGELKSKQKEMLDKYIEKEGLRPLAY